jgi:subfamily B ATP-binding cassette protein MsbA
LKKKLIQENFRWAFSFLRPFIWGFIGVFILNLGEKLSYLFLPSVSTKFLFELIDLKQIDLLMRYFFIAVALVISKSVFDFLKRYSMRIITHTIVKSMRDAFFSHLIALDINYFRENRTGNILSIGINDIEKVRVDFYQGLNNFFSYVVMLIILMTKLFILNWTLTLISFGVIPALYLVVRTIGNKMRSTNKTVRQILADLSTNLHETLTGMDVVKSFAQEEYEIGNFKNTTGKYRKTYLKLMKLSNIFGPLTDVIIYFCGVALIGVGSLMIIRGMWDAKGLTEYLLLLGIATTPITRIPKFIGNIKIATASLERVYDVIITEPKIKQSANPISRDVSGKVEFKNVRFSYEPNKRVLNGISFKAKKGEVIALVGPSGGGKTTIINLIPRFYDCDEGEILIDDINVKNYDIKSLRRQIGIVSQNVILFNTSIYENIRYSNRDATEEEIITAAKKSYAFDFIMDLPNKFETRVGEKGVKLSGGQKQRISIARTVLMNPQLLILDEATSSLDSESEHYIQLAINNLMEGRTSITVAHRLSTISHATKILVIDRGNIVDTGSHEELLKRCKLYSRIYNLQYFR